MAYSYKVLKKKYDDLRKKYSRYDSNTEKEIKIKNEIINRLNERLKEDAEIIAEKNKRIKERDLIIGELLLQREAKK